MDDANWIDKHAYAAGQILFQNNSPTFAHSPIWTIVLNLSDPCPRLATLDRDIVLKATNKSLISAGPRTVRKWLAVLQSSRPNFYLTFLNSLSRRHKLTLTIQVM